MAPEIDAQPKPGESEEKGEQLVFDDDAVDIDGLLVGQGDGASACGLEGEPPEWEGIKPEMEIVVEGVSAKELTKEQRDQIEVDIIDYLLTSTDLSVEGVTIPCRG